MKSVMDDMARVGTFIPYRPGLGTAVVVDEPGTLSAGKFDELQRLAHAQAPGRGTELVAWLLGFACERYHAGSPVIIMDVFGQSVAFIAEEVVASGNRYPWHVFVPKGAL